MHKQRRLYVRHRTLLMAIAHRSAHPTQYLQHGHTLSDACCCPHGELRELPGWHQCDANMQVALLHHSETLVALLPAESGR